MKVLLLFAEKAMSYTSLLCAFIFEMGCWTYC